MAWNGKGMTFPESTTSGEWYLKWILDEVLYNEASEVKLVLKCDGLPDDYMVIQTCYPNSQSTEFVAAVQEGVKKLHQLNFTEQIHTHASKHGVSDGVCAECGNPAAERDYLCDDCRSLKLN